MTSVTDGSESWAAFLECSRTGVTAPVDEPAFLSPAGAPWLVRYDLDPEKGQRLQRALPERPWSLWRYREVLPLTDFEGRVDLGEGGTPLVRLRSGVPEAVELYLKEESLNPTGSFKARGLSVAVNRARELGAPGLQLASAGNAALALSAYSAAAGVPCRVALPEDTPSEIAARCVTFGATVLHAPGTLVEAAASLRDGGEAYWDIPTLKEPYRAEGKKTMGYELAEQFGWQLPDWIVYPTGGGTGVVGMWKAFDELEQLGLVGPERPRMVSVQTAGCAPIVHAFHAGLEEAPVWEEPDCRVWGLRVPQAVADFLILRILRESSGDAVEVVESTIGAERARLAGEAGVAVGPEGGAAILAARQLIERGAIAPGERVVVFQTGHPGNYREAA